MSISNEIRVFENISDNPISFETKEDFNRYYERNKETVDAFSTRGLNKKYIITGYRIGRKKGEIILYPVPIPRSQSPTNDHSFEDLTMLEEKIDSMNERLKKIEQLLQSSVLTLAQNQSQMMNRSSHQEPTGFRQFYKN